MYCSGRSVASFLYMLCAYCTEASIPFTHVHSYIIVMLSILREWYSSHFPELVKIVPDNYLFARVVRYVGSRKDLTEERLDGLEEIVMDSTKAQAIFEAARMSMGEYIYRRVTHILNVIGETE